MRSAQSSTASKPKSSGRKGPMTDRQFIALIEERETRAEKAGQFNEDAARAIRYYMGEPFGTEVEGRSSVVMREVYSTIEWIKPALLRMFFGGDQVVKFSPKGPEDVKQAEQETDVVHHVVTGQNNGFATVYTWFTDALLVRNGYVVAYWDEKTDTTESLYKSLSLEEATMILQDKEAEILEAEESVDPATGEPRFTVRIRFKERVGRVVIETLPPERVLVEAGHKHVSLGGCNFVEYWEDKTLSSLREEGFKVDDDLSDENSEDGVSGGRDVVEQARMSRDTRSTESDDEDTDPASRKVRVRTIFIRADYDGDGIAEMRRVVAVGSTILQNETYDRVLIAALTPTILSHRHVGMSVADAVMDLQEIKSVLMRGALDGMYLSLNGRHAINEDTVNIDDLLTTRPGGVVRVAGDPGSAIVPLVTPHMGGDVLKTIEYMDTVAENRTGASPRVLQGQSVDGNAINKTATGINTIMSAAMARVELIARVFAETGVKELFQIVHTLLLKHGRKREVMQLRNQFVPVDPREWQKRTNMSVEVGLGTGDKQAKIALLQMLATAQQGLIQTGLATPQTMFNTLSKIVTEAGYKDPEEFFVNPSKGQMQPPQSPPDPKAMAEQARVSLDAEIAKRNSELEQMKIKADWEKTQSSIQLERAKSFLAAQVDLAKHAMSQDAQAQQSEAAMGQATEDRRAKLAERGVNDKGQPAKPRRKVVKHHRGPDGRIEVSEVIEVDDPDEEGST